MGACSVVALPEVSRWTDAKEAAANQQPDVALRFVYPSSPALVIVNDSDAVAREIKWEVFLWNMDLPDRNNPLPIPVSGFDWIKSHSESGPLDLFNSPTVTPLLKPGNRLFGSAGVTCAQCTRSRVYIVYIVWGSSGWFSEVGNDQSAGKVLVPRDFQKETRTRYFQELYNAVPPQSRIPIADR